MLDDSSTSTSRFSASAATLAVALAGSLLMFVSQPPLAWSIVGWIAPVPWLWLATASHLGRRPYLKLWLAGSLYWMAVLHWIRLAHPATIIGGAALSMYLGVYLPLWMVVVRGSVARLAIPLWIAAPVAWVATEWLQAHVLGGLLIGALSHSQIEWTQFVQIADLGGAYLVSFVVMMVASGLVSAVRAFRTPEMPRRGLRMALALGAPAAALAGSLAYGSALLSAPVAELREPVRIALIQGNHRAVWVHDPERNYRVMETYERLTHNAAAATVASGARLDLVVWPESMYRNGLYDYPDDYVFPPDTGMTVAEAESMGRGMLGALARHINTPLLVGIDRIVFHSDEAWEYYNSSAAVDRQGEFIGTYDKVHLVMFGEYVPLGTIWPDIYKLFPIGGLTPGTGPKAFAIEGTRYMPTICFETVLPHIVRNQVAELRAQGEIPDVLVNITNDSWFDDSSALEMHLTCSRYRAIECRTPLVVAANGGLSAAVDRYGRVLAKTKPMTEEALIAEVIPGATKSIYVSHGDWFALSTVVASGLMLVVAWRRGRPSSRGAGS